MSNKKQTAVEWLFNNYVDKGVITIEAIEQALAMEKEQIMDAWYNGFEEIIPYVDNSEQYYNETYEQQ
jgi:hypothetical protein